MKKGLVAAIGLVIAAFLAGARDQAMARTTADAGPASPQDDRLLSTTYVLPEAEAAIIKRDIMALRKSEAARHPGATLRYSEDISHFDGWLPMPGTLCEQPPPRKERYTWYFKNGRVTGVDFDDGKTHRNEYRIWYDKNNAPVLCVTYPHRAQKLGYAWADYDGRGLLRRVVHMSADFRVKQVELFENEDGYAATTQYTFDSEGRLFLRTRYIDNNVYVAAPPGFEDKRMNTGTRLWWLRRMVRYGFASIYPIPGEGEGTKTIPVRKTTPTKDYDPAAVELKIVKSTVTNTGVEEQSSGTFVVRNIGPAYTVPPDIIGPSYGVFIYDAQERLLFRNFGGWGPGMKAHQEIAFHWDTHSNHLGETSEPKFLIPKPGKYMLKIVLYRQKRDEVLDASTTWFDVPAKE